MYAFKCKQARQLYYAMQESIQKAGSSDHEYSDIDSTKPSTTSKRNEISAVSYVKSSINSSPIPTVTNHWGPSAESRVSMAEAINMYSTLVDICSRRTNSEHVSAPVAAHDYVNTTLMAENCDIKHEQKEATLTPETIAKGNEITKKRSSFSVGLSTASTLNASPALSQEKISALQSMAVEVVDESHLKNDPPAKSFLNKVFRRYKSESASLENEPNCHDVSLSACTAEVHGEKNRLSVTESSNQTSLRSYISTTESEDTKMLQKPVVGNKSAEKKILEHCQKRLNIYSSRKSALDTEHCYINLTVSDTSKKKESRMPSNMLPDSSHSTQNLPDSKVNYIMLDLSECQDNADHTLDACLVSPTRKLCLSKLGNGYAQIDFDKTAALSSSITKRQEEYGSRATRQSNEI